MDGAPGTPRKSSLCLLGTVVPSHFASKAPVPRPCEFGGVFGLVTRGKQPQSVPSSHWFFARLVFRGCWFLAFVSHLEGCFTYSLIPFPYQMPSAFSEAPRTTRTKQHRLAASTAKVIAQSQWGVRSGCLQAGPSWGLSLCALGGLPLCLSVSWIRATSVTSF